MIELDNVGYSYGRGGALLSDITLRLAPGSFHFLTGPSGAGKTTLLKLCYLELHPTVGRVHLYGVDGTRMTRDDVARTRQSIGVVHQDCRFLDHLSVAENIALPLTVSSRPVPGQDLHDLLHWVGLRNQAGQLPPELSGGNIDWEMSLKLLGLLVELNRMGKTVLIATHDLALIRAAKSQVATRVLRIQAGRLTLAGADL